MNAFQYFFRKLNLYILFLLIPSYIRCDDFLLNIEPFWNIKHNNNSNFFEINILKNQFVDTMIDQTSVGLIIQSTCEKEIYATRMYPNVEGWRITSIFKWKANLPKNPCKNPLHNLIVEYKLKDFNKYLQSKSSDFHIKNN